jgi:CHAT domain-containing protein
VRTGKAWYVTPDYPDPRYVLTEPAAEAAFLKQSFGAKAVPARTDRVMALLKKRDKVDLFHFAGHGGATGGSVEDARIFLQGRIDPNPGPGVDPYVTDELAAMQIREYGNLADPEKSVRPLVVLNACQVGRPGIQLTSIGGFAEAFIHAGAGGFVSSLWSVGDEPAASFTTEFYRRLKRGSTIADASVAAREAARNAGDATWLAYVVYAHPDAKLVRA